jgi:hypothetical protein
MRFLNNLLIIFLVSWAGLSHAGQELNFKSFAEAEAYRKKVLQALQVAQNPVYNKIGKATDAEISAYEAAVKDVDAFKKWVTTGSSKSVEIDNGYGYQRKSSVGIEVNALVRRKFSKAIWAVADAQVKTSGPYSRTDIGVAIKVMNDIRELFQLPIRVDRGAVPERVE